jgi:hypothetical protein
VEPKQHVKDVMKEKMRTGLPIQRKAVSHLPCAAKEGECSREHSQLLPPGLVVEIQEPVMPQTTVMAKWDTTVAVLPDPEPMVSKWAQTNYLIHPSDTLHETDAIGRCLATDCQGPPKDRLEAVVKQSSEPQLINNIVALVRACLAACSACDEFQPVVGEGVFRLWLPRHLPNGYLSELSASVELHL